MINKRVSSEIAQTSLRNLIANTNVTFYGPGSIVKTFIDSMAREVESLYNNIDINVAQSRLAYASGAFLDIIGNQFGLTRFGGASSRLLAEDKAVRFYVRSGRLIDYLPNASNLTTGLIPSGTTVSTSDGNVSFRIPISVTFPANATTVYVPVEPVDPNLGSRNNLDAGTITSHSLGNANILVENNSSVILSRDPETDSEFRLRISRYINSRVSGSRAAVLEAAFSFPGVSDIKILPFKNGAGSFEVLVIPTGSRVSPNVLAGIKSAVDQVTPFGTLVTVRGPDVIPVSLVVQIDIDKGQLQTIKQIAIDNAKKAMRLYIGNIKMGGELIISRLSSTILQSHSSIKDVRILQMKIDCKPQVIANYRLREDEVFDLDAKTANPLLVI